MVPKRRGPYVGLGLRRGRRKVAQGTSVPTLEVEQPEPQEEIRDMPQASERTVLRAPRTRKRRRGARAQDLPDIDPIASFSKEVPSVPTISTKVSPSQPSATLTLDVLQALMLTSMENQARMTQMMQTLVANQTTVQGTMTVESRYLKEFQRHKPPSFDGGKVDPIAIET